MKFATEQDSIDYFVSLLINAGWTNVNPTQSINKYAYYDIEGISSNGRRVRFELKRRDYDSTRFGDSIMEKDKYDKFISGINNKEFDKGVLVSFFNDCFTLDDVEKPTKIDHIYANHQTEFADHDIRKKTMVHYKQQSKHNY